MNIEDRLEIRRVILDIKVDNLSNEKVTQLISDHLHNMALYSPPESIHALDIEELKKPDITFWSAWEQAELVGCGALKALNTRHGEIKSMKTSPSHLRKGVAKQILQHIIKEAIIRGYSRLSLETGSIATFEPARILYEQFGFQYCAPFADYKKDANSVFMTKKL